MIEKERQQGGRIPVRFIDEEGAEVSRGGGDDNSPSVEELGRASAYEDATEMQRRINRGGESDTEVDRSRADDADLVGTIPDSELEENRNDQDSNPRDRRDAAAYTIDADELAADFPEQRAAGAAGRAGASVGAEAELLAAQAEVRLLEDEARKLRSERQELAELLARRQADFDNHRKRTERERGETYGRLVADVAGQLLPVLDNLRRALDAEASVKAGESQEFRNFLHGVELVARQFDAVLDSLGVKPVETVGRPFDPHVHEAVATERTEEFEPDTVTQEMQRGYRIGERLLRPAMVKVATR
jgi:molecular chaperone GrpE